MLSNFKLYSRDIFNFYCFFEIDKKLFFNTEYIFKNKYKKIIKYLFETINNSKNFGIKIDHDSVSKIFRACVYGGFMNIYNILSAADRYRDYDCSDLILEKDKSGVLIDSHELFRPIYPVYVIDSIEVYIIQYLYAKRRIGYCGILRSCQKNQSKKLMLHVARRCALTDLESCLRIPGAISKIFYDTIETIYNKRIY